MKKNCKFLEKIKNSDVRNTIQLYPEIIQEHLLSIREMIFTLATQNPDIGEIEETLKWGEPSYIAKHGSTIRLSWRKSSPENYGIFFNCKSKLVETFRDIYPTSFKYKDNRAIVFNSKQKIPKYELNHCLLLALTYHRVKHLDLLGA